MVSKKYWKKRSLDFIDIHKLASGIASVKMKGYAFDIFPDVFSPAISSDTQWFAEKLTPFYKNKKFLEIGTGAGVIACLAALNGAANVVATDINPVSVKNTVHNQKKHNLNFQVFHGNVFEPMNGRKEKFDIIFWNHPFNCTDEEVHTEDPLYLSVFDQNYEALRAFFKDGKEFLTENGQLLLGTGNIARINLIKKIANSEGYTIKLENIQEVPLHDESSIKMDVRLYSFKKQPGKLYDNSSTEQKKI